MSKGTSRPRALDRNVFINCPFDEDFRPCFEALLFAVAAAGYKVRCALEDADSAAIRFEKLRKLIRECPRTIHDLSRIELSKDALPRFNMPFELGLAMGAKYFGDPRQRWNTALIMVRKDYVLSAYLSDLGGNDPVAHNGDPDEVVPLSRASFTSRQQARCCPDRAMPNPGSSDSNRGCPPWPQRSIGTRTRCTPTRTTASTLRSSTNSCEESSRRELETAAPFAMLACPSEPAR
jgi:hypothetical protein